jgi:soluble lytic murein transglycosylase-like protein
MRGIGRTLSRLPAARAFVLGAAVLAASAGTKAYGQAQPNEDTALAVPRVSPYGPAPGGASLLQPLPPSEAARLRRLFTLQARGDIAEAVRQALHLDLESPLVHELYGHLLADRHLGPHTRTPAEDLQAWLARWPTLPDAPAIHSLLKRRLARGTALPPAPVLAPLSWAEPAPAQEEAEPTARALPRLPEIDRAVREAARNGPAGAAARAIRAAGPLPPGYGALLRGESAQILFALNRDREAWEIAAPGAESCPHTGSPSCVTVALAGHWAGLAAWRMGRVAEAREMFRLAWQADIATPAQRAAAAFWAARAQLRLGEEAAHRFWLTRAAQQPRAFHSLLARRMLGLALDGDPLPRETLGEADVEAVAAHPAGLRAFALLQIGQRDRAEAELRLLWPEAQASPGLVRAIMLVAERGGLPALAAQLAELAEAADGRPRDRTRFAVPRLRPAGGFTTDPALVFAIARIESNFDPAAVSPAGARGLMQIMPGTARFLAGLAEDSERLPALHDPAVNLSLGQRYLNFLAATDIVGGDKLRLLASYNTGPGAFSRWGAAIRDQGDPLLFLEAIPIDETRAFIPRVLAHTWLYANRLGLPTPSLDELAAGAWPRYAWDSTTAATLH